jgi:D-alanyl-D-alanine carboxypeptidase
MIRQFWGSHARTAAVAALAATVTLWATGAEAQKRRGYSPPQASIVIDHNTGAVLHQSQPDALRHPASLTKVMTLYMLFEQIEAGKLKLDTPLPISAYAASQSPSKLGLRAGQTIEVEDAIRGLVTKSANDAAVVVAEALGGDEDAFARQMTRKARALGMSRTVYRNASGLPDSRQVTTARDQAILGRAIQDRFPRYYRYFATTSFRYRGVAHRNHNRLLGRVEGIDGIKTGYTRASGFNLISNVRRDGRHVVAVVLGGSSAASRDRLMASLLEGNIMEASLRRTAPRIVERDVDGDDTVATRTRVAEAQPERETPRAAPAPAQATAPAAAPVQMAAMAGSTEPLRPIPVRTVPVGGRATAETANVARAMQVAALPAAPMPITPPSVREPEPTVVTASLPPVRPTPVPTTTIEARPAQAAAAGTLGTLTMRPAAPVETRRAETKPEPAHEQRREEPRRDTRHPDRGDFVIQVGAFPNEGQAREQLRLVQTKMRGVLASADGYTERVQRGQRELFRARFAGLERSEAESACRALQRNDIACMAVRKDS